jgi:hypothetical protein
MIHWSDSVTLENVCCMVILVSWVAREVSNETLNMIVFVKLLVNLGCHYDNSKSSGMQYPVLGTQVQ